MPVAFAPRSRSARLAGAFLGALLGVAPAMAAERWAVVAPAADSAFYEAVAEGCRARAAQLSLGTCLLFAPGGAESRDQGRIVADLVADKVDGIAVSPALISEVLPAVRAARAAGIPVVAYDADLPPAERSAFIGTDARDFGRALGATLGRWRPDGGLYAILAGDPASRALADRAAGVRDALGPGWTEIPGSPVAVTGESREAARRLDQLLLDHGELDAVVSVGAWPLLAEDTWREIAKRHRERLDRARVVLVVADALPVEKKLVRDGLAHVLVGQRPADMGARIVETLAALKSGRRTAEIVYVGFEVFTRRDLLGRPD